MFLLSELILKNFQVNIDLWKSPFWDSSAAVAFIYPLLLARNDFQLCVFPSPLFTFITKWVICGGEVKMISPLSVI